jgi:hypothetical protein
MIGVGRFNAGNDAEVENEELAFLFPTLLLVTFMAGDDLQRRSRMTLWRVLDVSGTGEAVKD